ncbi:MAG: hypothetical protein WBB69_14945 [Anaerolineales bacterium]
MNRIYQSRILVLITLTLAILSVGCNGNTSINRDFRMKVQLSHNGQITRSFNKFYGVEQGSLTVDKGQRIALNYKSALQDGSLIFKCLDPSGMVIWEKFLSESISGTDEIVAGSPGRYTFLVQGQQAAGYINFTWDVE